MDLRRRFFGDSKACYKNGEKERERVKSNFLLLRFGVAREKASMSMERNTAGKKPHTSTAYLLTSSEVPPPDSPFSASRSAVRSHQPSDGISKVVVGGRVIDEEVESLNRRCQRVIEMLQACCEKCNNESTHCGSVAALLKQIKK